MKTVFDQLREELKSVDSWLDQHLQRHLPAKERELAEQLKRYVGHCYRDELKWRSEFAAETARINVQEGWSWLFLQNAKRRTP